MSDLIKPIDQMTDEELFAHVREIRHRRETLRPARADRIVRVEKKESRAKVKKTANLLDGLSPEDILKLMTTLGEQT